MANTTENQAMQDTHSARLLRLVLTGMLVVCVWTAALGATQSPSEAQPAGDSAAQVEQATEDPRAADDAADESSASRQSAADHADAAQADAAQADAAQADAAQADAAQGSAASSEMAWDAADQEGAAPPVEFVPPAECSTGQIELTPTAQDRPYWLFVMNFNVVRAGRPTACVLVYHAGAVQPFAAISIPCVRVGRGIGLRDGQAIFSGGSLRCDVDLRQRVAELDEADARGRRVALDARYSYRQFTIIGAGELDGAGGRVEPYGNPILFYRSYRSSPPVGLFAPLVDQTRSAASYSLLARANGRDYRSEGCSSEVKGVVEVAGGMHAWSMLYGVDQPGVLELRADDQTVCRYEGVPPVSFRTDGASFRIGASTLGGAFRGTLDEMVVDPTGGTRPPGSK
jgi:hypothetical protein